jgi:uncharacterized membrane protein YphA (DoxX/SURF4 family)
MKIALIIIRLLMGLIFLSGSLAYFLNAMPQPELSANVKLFMDGMLASVYLLPLVKVVEFLCGAAFVSGFFVPLASVVIAPIIVNILFFQIFLDPSGLPVGIFLVVANSILAYAHWEKFRPMLVAK